MDPDPKGSAQILGRHDLDMVQEGKMTYKKRSEEISCFEVLDVLS